MEFYLSFNELLGRGGNSLALIFLPLFLVMTVLEGLIILYRQGTYPWKNAGVCSACWSKTSSSDPRGSPSATASPSANAPPAVKNQPTTTTRRVTISRVAHCVGGVISPVLANLFMHYAFDKWLEREFPAVEFERYADDAVVHCTTQRQAREVLAALEQRMAEVGLQLHPDKTRIVYCKDRKRCQRYDGPASFTFLGYTFRARKAPTRDGTSMFAAIPPGGQQGRPQQNERGTPLLAHPHAHRHGTGRHRLLGQPRRQRMDGLLRQVLPDRAERPAAAHQRLPGALGTTEVQAAADIQESPQVVGGTARKAARHVRPLGLDGRGPQQPVDETSGVTGDCHAPFCGSPGVRFPRATRQR